jgi:hypothetical protein
VTSPWWQDGRPRALHGDVAALNVVNVVEPEKAYFAAGTLAVLGDRLDDADMQFSAALARTDPARSCPARINLDLVRETLGDRAARALDTNSARHQVSQRAGRRRAGPERMLHRQHRFRREATCPA